jgi:aspartate racemase
MNNEKIIGIVGGVGPHAGIDLCRKIFDQTKATRDQEHLPVAILSAPGSIEDRTAFLLGKSKINPGFAIIDIIKQLEHIGATVIGIPCNASHSPEIFNVIIEGLRKADSRVKLIHMISEVGAFVREYYPGLENIGVLSAAGTYKSNVYEGVLSGFGLSCISPDEYVKQEVIHKSIYHGEYGIKANPNPVTPMARELLQEGIMHLKRKGAEAIILGCTEIPLAIPERQIDGMPIIDSSLVLARALIRAAAPEKLRLLVY